MAETQWYYAEGTTQKGPVPEATIDDLIAGGVIGANTLVWRDGLEDWDAASAHFPAAAGVTVAQTGTARQHGHYDRPVGWWDAVRLFFGRYAEFGGRSNRGEFWKWALINIVISSVLYIPIYNAAFELDPNAMNVPMEVLVPMGLLGAWVLATFIPTLALMIRRLHDTGRSGWWIILYFVPVIGPIVMIVFWAMRPEPGPNAWG